LYYQPIYGLDEEQLSLFGAAADRVGTAISATRGARVSSRGAPGIRPTAPEPPGFPAAPHTACARRRRTGRRVRRPPRGRLPAAAAPTVPGRPGPPSRTRPLTRTAPGGTARTGTAPAGPTLAASTVGPWWTCRSLRVRPVREVPVARTAGPRRRPGRGGPPPDRAHLRAPGHRRPRRPRPHRSRPTGSRTARAPPDRGPAPAQPPADRAVPARRAPAGSGGCPTGNPAEPVRARCRPRRM